VIVVNAPYGDNMQPIDDNPFPARPAAEVQDLADDVVSVKTSAIDEATRLLSSYFQRTTPQGMVLTVIGEAGTGKTHLLFELLRQALRRRDLDTQYAYVDAQGGDFLSLYRGNFLMQFDRDDVVRRIREYYANIVADSIENTGFPADITARLRNTDIDPQRFVTQFNLPESTFLAKLNTDLSTVTHNEEFGTALMLLLRGDLGDAVWEWLRGEEPSPVLVERGIQSRIKSDAQAIDAMGVIALLYRGRSSNFVLAFDQLDKVLPSSSRPPGDTVAALHQMIGLMADQGIFLVLSGLPEFLDAIGQHGQEHGVTASLTTNGLPGEHVRSYIEQNIAKTHYRTGTGPFSQEVVDYIAALAGRSARQMVQICHYCYRVSLQSGVVTTTMVEQAARGRSEISQGIVRKRILEELDKLGLAYHTSHPVDGIDGPRAPYWVPTGDTGCALILTDSLTLAEDTSDLIESAKSIQAAAPGCRIGLIINGVLSDPARKALKNHFSERPLIYAPERFADDFSHLLRHMTEQLDASGDDQIRVLRASMSRLATAQSGTQHYLELLAFQIESMQEATEKHYADLTRELQTLNRDERRPLSADDVEHLFTEVMVSLEALTGLDAALGQVFGEEPSGVASGLLLRLQNREIMRAVGVAALAETVVGAFRDAVREWSRHLDGQPTADQRRRLSTLCRNYETVLEYLPIQLLSTLAELVPNSASWNPVVGQTVGGRLSQTDMYTLLTDLGYKLRQAAGLGGARG
jgi:hypothetical protein